MREDFAALLYFKLLTCYLNDCVHVVKLIFEFLEIKSQKYKKDESPTRFHELFFVVLIYK